MGSMDHIRVSRLLDEAIGGTVLTETEVELRRIAMLARICLKYSERN